ncbi:MAG: metallophosphoesterase [Candidatus Promineifilaceae bacterium]
MSERRSRARRILFAWREGVQISLAQGMHALGRDRFDAADFAVVPVVVPMSGLDPVFEGYRIVQISDLHMGHWLNAERLEGVAGLVNAQSPDLIVITGDFVSYSLRQVAGDMVNGLSLLDAPDGVVAVLGNHDHWLDPNGVRRLLRAAGVRELPNEVLSLQRGAAHLHIAGIDDLIAGEPDFEQVLRQIPARGAAVLLAHEPDFADESAASGRFGLQLSGHSHGGQILLPGIGPIRGHMFRRYPLGRYQVGHMVQYTNPGIGTHVLRLRINVPPEITVFTLAAI